MDMINTKGPKGIRSIPGKVMDHGSKFDGSELLKMLKVTGFQDITQLDQRALIIGFIRVRK